MGSWGREDTVEGWQGSGGNQLAEWAVPHSYVIDKNQDGYLGNERSQSQARSHNPGSQHRKDKA